MSWLTDWLPSNPDRVWTVELWLAVLLAVSVVASGVFGFVLWQVSNYRGSLEKKMATKQLAETKDELSEAQRRGDATLAQTREELAKEQKKARELEARLRPRQLSPEDVGQIADALRVAGSFKVHMIRGSGDAEASQLANQMKVMFERAGWAVVQDLVDLTGSPRFGLHIYASQDPPNAGVVALYHALKSKDLDFQLFRDTNLAPDVIRIQVGSKQR
jgi:hypothetical protein